MKLRENMILRQVADTWIVLPVGEATVEFDGMLSLNETGAFLWQCLQNGAGKDALIDALVKEYEIPYQIASSDVNEFLNKLVKIGCLEIK